MNPIMIAAAANELAVLRARAELILGEGVGAELRASTHTAGGRTHVDYSCLWRFPIAGAWGWSCHVTIGRDGYRRTWWSLSSPTRGIIGGDSNRRSDDAQPHSIDGLDELRAWLEVEQPEPLPTFPSLFTPRRSTGT